MQSVTDTAHPAPSIQKALSQTFRRQQVADSSDVGAKAAALWTSGFSIKRARDSWSAIRPAILVIAERGYKAGQADAQTYYSACRLTAGLGPLPAAILARVKFPTFAEQHADKTADSTGLGWFLHMVKGGVQMMDAYNSARDLLSASVARLVLQGARDWLEAAAWADPDAAGVRRVTGGTCAFCENLAGLGVDVGNSPTGWHDNCECTPEPAFRDDTGPSPSLPDSGAGQASGTADNILDIAGMLVSRAGSDALDDLGEDDLTEAMQGNDGSLSPIRISRLRQKIRSGELTAAQIRDRIQQQAAS